MKPKIYRIQTIKHSGQIQNWPDYEEADVIKLAQDLESQWLLDHGYDPENIGIDEALEALMHDYAEWEILGFTKN
jgi:hypothetical protein